MKALRWLGLLLGIGLFLWVLRTSDLSAVWGQLRILQWRFGLVLLFYIVIFGLDTLGWQFVLRRSSKGPIRWDRLFRARLAGEAVNYVTPTAWIGGEPVKAALLSRRYGVPMADGMASVVLAKTTFTFSMLLFVLVGLAVALATQQVPSALMKWVWLVLPLLSGLISLFLLVQFLKPFQRGSSMIGRVMPAWFEKLGSKVREWDRAVVSLYRSSPGSVFWSLGFHFLGWIAGVVEVYLILSLLKISVSWATAFRSRRCGCCCEAGPF